MKHRTWDETRALGSGLLYYRELGWTRDRIAQRCGLSRERVRQLCERELRLRRDEASRIGPVLPWLRLLAEE